MADPESKMKNPYAGKEDTGVVTVGRGFAWAIITAFLLVCVLPPIGRHLYEAKKGTGGENTGEKDEKPWFPAVEFFRNQAKATQADEKDGGVVDHLRVFEGKLEDAEFTNPPREWVQKLFTPAFREGNRKTYIGKDGWLFFRPAVDGLTGYGPLKPEPDTVAKDPNRPGFQGPLEVLLDFQSQLAEREIDLLLVPVPVKPMIRPEMIAGGEFDQPLGHVDQEVLYEKLRAGGVEILDLSEGFWARRAEEDVFMRQDTHWTPATMKWAAAQVADALRAHGVTNGNLQTELRQTPRTDLGDLVKKLDMENPPFEVEAEDLQVVIDTATGQPLKSDGSAPVVLLGDSFVNIFDDPGIGFGDGSEEKIGAGFAQHLAAALGQKIDSVAINGEASSGVRRDFARKGSQSLADKKVVVYLIASRDLLYSETSARDAEIKWEFVPLPEKVARSTDGNPTSNTGTQIADAVVEDVTLTILRRTTTPDPKEKTYPNSLYALTAKIDGRDDEVMLYAYAFKAREFVDTANLQLGKRYRMRLSKWEGKTDIQSTPKEEFEDFLLLDTYFVESFELLD